ncbi:MAG: GGDEF domain-containing protein [Nitriliruptoraceae bacterium]
MTGTIFVHWVVRLTVELHVRVDVPAAADVAIRTVAPGFSILVLVAFLALGARVATWLTAGFVVAYLAAVIPRLVTDVAADGWTIAATDLARVGGVAAALVMLVAALARRVGRADAAQSGATTAGTVNFDPVTGLLARPAAANRLGELVELAGRHDRPLTVALIDVDEFGSVAAAGHGDQVLRDVGATIANLLRASDVVARWGDDAFLAVLPETPAAQAVATMQRVLDTVRTDVVGGAAPVTVSIGIGQRRLGDQPDELVDRARQAMDVARRDARDRVEVDDFGLEPPAPTE